MKSLIFIELNEINFDLVKLYVQKFPLRFPGFEKLLVFHNICTYSEDSYELLEPWIQWVSVHTGKSYSEHNIYRLGDTVGSKIPQIFEELEATGVSIGGISPMNTENRLKKAAYFIPDPWTKTPSDPTWWSRHLGAAISQAVNDNAQSKITKESVFFILLGFFRFAKFRHYILYLKLAFCSIKASWRRALALDLFLHDLHTNLFDSKQPQFSVLFLNAGAHIQHHYLHNSPFVSVDSGLRNPSWYLSSELDPFFEMLEIYDRIINEYLANEDCEYIIATGLSQCPYDQIKYYYRLKDHVAFLRKLGITFLAVHPRMTRDFLIVFESIADATKAHNILSELRISKKSEPLFREIENRGDQLFVTLTYPDEIVATDVVKWGTNKLEIFHEVAFVAIKNGMHQSKGFAFFSPGIAKLRPENGSHVKGLYSSVMNYFNKDRAKLSQIF